MLTGMDKAIVALITNLLIIMAAFGIERPEWLSDEMLAGVGTVANVMLVWLIPNKQ